MIQGLRLHCFRYRSPRCHHRYRHRYRVFSPARLVLSRMQSSQRDEFFGLVDGIWIDDIFVAQETEFIILFKRLQHYAILSSIPFTCRFNGCFGLAHDVAAQTPTSVR